ncbi:MAG: DUF1326 domain-containing protein [Gammaproteobacteria bacterium]|nr:DUF1326 domain-containing protein [Gammaproteobacteria bacterium]MCP5199665.1 DUF1326 domain-containing protein [Gammaproteobacteria bacterium]
MATQWSARGEYMEACSCDFLCPCITKNSTTPASHEYCKVALAFDTTDGSFGGVSLAGVRWVFFAQSKAIMAEGEWIGGLVVDTSASDEQVAAIAAICGPGAGDGPGNFAPLISDFRGIERHPIEFVKNGKQVQVKIDGLLDQAVVGIDSMTVPDECIVVDNTFHPVNKRLNLASAVRNFIRAFGIEWHDDSGRTNGHFAPFDWKGEIAA